MTRPKAILAAILTALAAGGALFVEGMLGVPDGHLTEYDSAYSVLLKGYAAASVLLTLAFVATGVTRARRRLVPLFIAFALLTAGFFAVDVLALSGLEHGQGG